jgi:D-sedoheptulose 7-phosphate isomerase
LTCIANDFGYSEVFDRQMAAFAQSGDVAIGLTTSGKSENVVKALAVARAKGAVTIALTGSNGLVGGEADHLIAVPSSETAHIQEVHLMVLHDLVHRDRRSDPLGRSGSRCFSIIST